MNVFLEPNCDEKLKGLELHIEAVMSGKKLVIPDFSAREVLVLDLKLHPPKKGLSFKDGQARLLHDLASIELQAMELALRTLTEYEGLNPQFQEEMIQLIKSEASHFSLCLRTLRDWGFNWGDWPVHLALWNALSKEDTLEERIFIVHRDLEGSGLDAADTILRRLKGLEVPTQAMDVLTIITAEEIGHVQFGSHWFHDFCRQKKLDSDQEFRSILQRKRHSLPKRVEPINFELRKKALFNDFEIQELNQLRESFLSKDKSYVRGC